MNASKLPLEPPEQPSLTEAQSFNYAALDSETRMFLLERARDIKERLRNTARTAWEIGQNLVEVRERLNYGYFVLWLRAEFEWSERTAYNYINIFESFGSFATFAKLETAASASALYLLAAPSTPQDARQEALNLVGGGKSLSYKEAKTIVTRHKDALKSKGFWSVTVDTSAQTVSTSTLSRPIESAPQTKPNLEFLDEPEDELDEVDEDEVGNNGAGDAIKHDDTAEDLSYEAPLEKEVEPEGVPLRVSAQPKQMGEIKTSVAPIEDEDSKDQSSSELPGAIHLDLIGQPLKPTIVECVRATADEGCPFLSRFDEGGEVSDEPIELYEVTTASSNRHIEPRANGTQTLPNLESNHSSPVEVDNHSLVASLLLESDIDKRSDMERNTQLTPRPISYFASAPSGTPDATILAVIESQFGSMLEKLAHAQKFLWAIALISADFKLEGFKIDWQWGEIPAIESLWQLSPSNKLNLAVAVLIYLQEAG